MQCAGVICAHVVKGFYFVVITSQLPVSPVGFSCGCTEGEQRQNIQAIPWHWSWLGGPSVIYEGIFEKGEICLMFHFQFLIILLKKVLSLVKEKRKILANKKIRKNAILTSFSRWAGLGCVKITHMGNFCF